MATDSGLDRFTEIDELLTHQINLLHTLVVQSGVAQTEIEESQAVLTPYEDVPIPETGNLYGVPSGTTIFDFDKGEIRNNNYGILDANLRKFDDMVDGVQGATFQALRSLYIYADAPVTLNMGKGRAGQFTLTQGSFYPLNEHSFRQFSLQSDEPVAVQIDVSTRSTAFTQSDSVTGYMSRYGTDSDASNTAYTSVPVYPEQLETTMDNVSGSSATDDATEEIFIGGVTRTSIYVENTHGSNTMDARIQVADTDKVLSDSTLWYETTGSESTGIAAGDYTNFDLAERHRWLRIQYKANTSGQDASAEVQLHGGLD